MRVVQRAYDPSGTLEKYGKEASKYRRKMEPNYWGRVRADW
jgi:hypothetical protein